jgi:2-dehydro-3-deoxygluconokinase
MSRKISGKLRVVCFGEVMLRLTAPRRGLLLEAPCFDATFGGAEANVAVSLARLGTEAALVTILPENALGRAALTEIGRHGVGTGGVRFAPGRLGIYFVTQGAGIRASEVLYDRTNSAFAEAAADAIDWSEALVGAMRLHISGVTPAIGANAAAASVRAANEASRLGVALSFDGNYRPSLWSRWNGDAPAILKSILANADIAFLEERDIALILGRTFEADDKSGQRPLAVRAAFEHFPKLAIIACTTRRRLPGGGVELGASLYSREASAQAQPIALGDIIDRIGAGDAFAAGLLHGLGCGMAEADALEFALAAAAYKHSLPGDFNLVSEAELLQLMRDGPRDVRR